VAGLALAIGFDSLLQLTWKTTVLEVPSASSPIGTLAAVFNNPLFIAVIVIMALQFFNWLMVLAQADLSFAKPISSLSYVTVPLLSFLLLHEALDGLEITGIALVIAGVWCINQTTPDSRTEEPQA
jgi:drug/metabolite transporter (DMT)-like permease